VTIVTMVTMMYGECLRWAMTLHRHLTLDGDHCPQHTTFVHRVRVTDNGLSFEEDVVYERKALIVSCDEALIKGSFSTVRW
jgi:hypothetical protein